MYFLLEQFCQLLLLAPGKACVPLVPLVFQPPVAAGG